MKKCIVKMRKSKYGKSNSFGRYAWRSSGAMQRK